MTSPLDSSVTLGDALELVESRRIPIAPEVAGYLCLELAERASMQPGGLLPEGVFLGEEGSVAFVPRADAEPPEQFVRSLLRRLLDVSASRPPALWQATTSTRPGLEALVRELEAALIPLNRMASRRSLARLAREVKRVTHGVGRNAPSSVRRPPGESARPQSPPPQSPPAPLRQGPAIRARVVAAPSTAPADSVHSAPVQSAPETARAPQTARAAEISRAPETPRVPTPPAMRAAAPTPVVETPARVSAIDELLSALDPAPAPMATETAETQDATRWRLKEIAGLEPTPPPPTAHVYEDDEPAADDEDEDGPSSDNPTDEEGEAVEALLVASAAGPQSRLAEAMRPSRPHLPRVQVPATKSDPDLPASTRVRTPTSTPPKPAFAHTASSLDRAPLRVDTPAHVRARARSGGGGRTVAFTLLVVFGLTLGLVYVLRPEWMLGHKLPAPVPSSSAAPEKASARSCSIRIVGAPDGAEILVLQGHAPLDVSPMPAGARIEFVGLLPGYAPKRAVVPAQGKWDPDEHGRPRYELALELAPSHKKADPWPPAEAGTTVGGEGDPGTVRVVSSPRDAEVWLLFGAGPEAALDPISCTAHEVLVASGTSTRTRLAVAPEDFVAKDGGNATATLDAHAATTKPNDPKNPGH